MSAPPDTIGTLAADFEAIVERLPDALFVQSGEEVVYANDRFCELLGRPHGSLVPCRLQDLVAPLSWPSVHVMLNRAASESASTECAFIRSGGILLETDLRGAPVVFNGRAAVACVARDLSERKSFQARLMLSDRMASVGTLAAGVAHEINNPLAFVIINLAYVSEQLDRLVNMPSVKAMPELQLAEILDAIGEAQEGSQRVRRIVHDLRTFARADEEKRESVKLAQVLEACISMAWNEIRHRAQLEREFEEVPPIHANRARLSHAFLNLIVNAAQAIPAGNAEKNLIRIGLRRVGSEKVRVSISDTGQGIAQEILPRIFDPFFTTKPVGVGTGLGLSIVHGTVAAMGGTVSVESEPGRGTTFSVDLPLMSAPSHPLAPAVPPLSAKRGRVLVVDDELSVGTSLRRGLRSHHDVDFVVSASAALETLAAATEPYDVILCDLMMPDMSGMELYEELQRRWPDATERLIFFTGGAFVDEAQAFLDRIPNPRVEKPLDLNQVKNLIQELLSLRGAVPGQ